MEDYSRKTRQVSVALVEAPVIDGFGNGGFCGGEELQRKAELEYLKQIMEDIGVGNFSGMKRLAQKRSGWRIASNQSVD